MTARRTDVYAAIDREREYQDSLSPTSESGGVHSVAEWVLYMEDYIAQARSTSARTWGPEARTATLDVIRKITAMGVACMEQNGVVFR